MDPGALHEKKAEWSQCGVDGIVFVNQEPSGMSKVIKAQKEEYMMRTKSQPPPELVSSAGGNGESVV